MRKVMINRDNYESFAVDFLEVKLDAEARAAFTDFLRKNPDLEEEVLEMQNTSPVLEYAGAPHDFNHLKKVIEPVDGINGDNYEEIFLTALEGQQVLDISGFLAKNPMLENDWELYQKTTLKADKQLFYPEKARLRRPVPLFALPRTTIYWSAAASIAILFMVTMQLRENQFYLPREMPPFVASDGLTSDPIVGHHEQSPEGTIEESVGAKTEKPQPGTLGYIPLRKGTIPRANHAEVMENDRGYEGGLVAVNGWHEERPLPENSPGRVLTVTQFLAESVTGKEIAAPQEVGKTVLATGISKLGEITGVEVVPGNPGAKGKSIHILAGAFEFKHTLGKNN